MPFSRPHSSGLRFLIPFSGPDSPNYVTLESRLETFSSWPHSFINPVDLAEAGFRFTGYEDQVECFFCGLILSDWKIDDCPFVEHAYHVAYNGCAYFTINKRKVKTREQPVVVDGDRNICKICNLYEAKYVYLPCSHFSCCPICVCTQDKCPVCRTPVSHVVKIFT